MRNEALRSFRVGDRIVKVKVMETISVEDAYDVLFSGVMHRYASGENAIRPVPREVKDFLLKTNLTI